MIRAWLHAVVIAELNRQAVRFNSPNDSLLTILLLNMDWRVHFSGHLIILYNLPTVIPRHLQIDIIKGIIR